MSATPRQTWIALVALAAAFFAQGYSASRIKSPTWDEPYHMAQGLGFLETGRIFNPLDQTPLILEINASLLPAAGIHWPATDLARQVVNKPDSDFRKGAGLLYAVGMDVLHTNGPDRVLFWSRLPVLLLATGFLFVIYLFGRATLGNAAGLGAAFLYAFDPNIIAQSFLATTDAGLAFFTLLLAFALWSYVQRPTLLRLVLAGMALGAVICAKYSAIVLLPVSAIMLAAAAFWPPVPGAPASIWQRLLSKGLAFAGMCLVAVGVMECVYLFPANVFHVYLQGLHNVSETPEGTFFLAGKIAHRFYDYYLVTWLLKEPLPVIFSVATGLFVTLWHWKTTRLALIFLLLPSVTFFALYSALANDFGMRYIDSILPFLHILGGAGLAWLLTSASLKRRLPGIALALWLPAAAAGIYPDHLSYFNESACLLTDPAKLGADGGSACGIKWLDECNVDWGQGLKQLDAWMKQNEPGKRFYFSYFGSFPPAYYGIDCDLLSADEVLKGKMRGLVVVSTYFVASMPQRFNRPDGEWMQKTKPIAIVGHAYYIYDLH